jgi:histone acetyltransferase (RNA polymerase elongator complex component)
MKARPFIIPIFIPNMGCPYRCVFCDQTAITGQQDRRLSPRLVRERISEFLSLKTKHRGTTEVAFYGGNFLGLPKSYRQSLLEEAQKFLEKGRVEGIRFSTRPDTVTDNTLETLRPYTVRVVEVGAQSMDDTVLFLSRRGHTAEDTEDAVARLKAHGVGVGVQIMPGLPGDTLESILETGRKVADLNPDFVRIYPTIVVKNTVLDKWYRSGEFKPLSLTDAVEVTKRLYLLFQTHGISVIRMGLQTTGSLLEPGAVVAGPFHPAFGHLVHSAIFLDLAARELEMQETASKRITLSVHPDNVSRLKGLKNDNTKKLIQRFRLEELQVLPDPGIPQNALKVTNVL